MKKIFTLITLGSAVFVTADQYNQPYGYRDCTGPSCREGYNEDNYYQQNQRQNSQGYYQRDDRYNQYDQQNYRQQDSQLYDRDQPRNYNNPYGRSDNQKPASDQEVNKKIQDAIGSGWFSKGYQGVSFDVNNGNVTLRGTVDSQENRNKVEEAVRKIEGVRNVNNQITITRDNSNTNAYSESQLQSSEKKYPQDRAASPQDRQLNAKIRDKLGSGWFSKGYETLVIRTNNGVVVISGSVDKIDDAQKIIDQLNEIEGIRAVNNQLRVNNR